MNLDFAIDQEEENDYKVVKTSQEQIEENLPQTSAQINYERQYEENSKQSDKFESQEIYYPIFEYENKINLRNYEIIVKLPVKEGQG